MPSYFGSATLARLLWHGYSDSTTLGQLCDSYCGLVTLALLLLHNYSSTTTLAELLWQSYFGRASLHSYSGSVLLPSYSCRYSYSGIGHRYAGAATLTSYYGTDTLARLHWLNYNYTGLITTTLAQLPFIIMSNNESAEQGWERVRTLYTQPHTATLAQLLWFNYATDTLAQLPWLS